MPESRTSPRRIRAKERQHKALELRKSGKSFQAIARELDYRSRQSAQYSVEAALRSCLEIPCNELRQLDLERLDDLLLGLWPRKHELAVIDRILKILERRAKLLGLDGPMTIDIAVTIREMVEAEGISDEAEIQDYIDEAHRIIRDARRRLRGGRWDRGSPISNKPRRCPLTSI